MTDRGEGIVPYYLLTALAETHNTEEIRSMKKAEVRNQTKMLILLQQFEPEALMDYEEIEFLQPETFDLPIDLSLDQRRKLIRLEADLIINEVKLERDIELVLLDLEAIFTADTIDPAKVDKQVMKLADLAAGAIDNRVDFFIESKDVLTLEQKRMLSYLMGLD